MKYYEVLFRYLTESNFQEDGSPTKEDDYYFIGRIKAENDLEALTAIERNDFNYLSKHCAEVGEILLTANYVPESIEIVQMLSIHSLPLSA